MNFHTLFDHIWSNLLTQCTSVSVPVFCCFCILGFLTIKSAPKIPKKIYKKSAQRNLPESSKEGRRGPTRAPGALVARPRARARQGGALLPSGLTGCPPSPIYFPHGGNP